LREIGLPAPEDKVMAVILCLKYRLPIDELVTALRLHCGPITESAIRQSLEQLVEQYHLLKRTVFDDQHIIEIADDWKDLNRATWDGKPLEPDFIQAVATVRMERRKNLIARVGWATEVETSQDLQRLIENATEEIRLGIFSGITVYPQIKKALFMAMCRGVKTKILMFTPELGARIDHRRESGEDCEVMAKKWKALGRCAIYRAKKQGRTIPALEIRWIDDDALTAFHRGVLVDGKHWRFNIHRTNVDHGVTGIVYGGESEPYAPTNIYTLLDYYWKRAWEQSVSPDTTWLQGLLRFPIVYRFLAFSAALALAFGIGWILANNLWWLTVFTALVSILARDALAKQPTLAGWQTFKGELYQVIRHLAKLLKGAK
jgi:hypothetical protein